MHKTVEYTQPFLKKGERLKVYLFEKYQSFDAQIRADKGKPPGRSAGGYYWPPSKTVYQYRQPTTYYTRQLLIHECVHQFHFLSSTKNKSPHDDWYIEGIAEYLSRHMWNGSELRLGVIPPITLKDFPAEALKRMSAPGYKLSTLVDSSRESHRSEQWALIHWLCREDPKARKRWKQISTSLNKLKPAASLESKIIGSPKKTLPKILSWLEKNQEPMSQVFNQWEGTASGCFRGTASVISLCRTKEPCDEFKATLIAPEDKKPWSGGIMLHWLNRNDYSLLLVRSDGTWKIDRRGKERWQNLMRGRIPKRARKRDMEFVIRREKTGLRFKINGANLGVVRVPATSIGLSVDNSTLLFKGVSWKASTPKPN